MCNKHTSTLWWHYHTAIILVIAVLTLCSTSLALRAHADSVQTSEEPASIINGDFNYPPIPQAWWIPFHGTKRFLTINPHTAQAGAGCTNESMFHISNFSPVLFGWSSTQPTLGTCSSNNVELNYSPATNNTYAELVADIEHTSIYQDIATIPGAVYMWSLRHASASSAHDDSMRVLIGAANFEQVQEARRTETGIAGRQLGPIGTIMETPSSSSDYSMKEWERYQGSYLVPQGQVTTRFMFDSVSAESKTSGNNLDDISFEITYPLIYNKNGGTGTVPFTGFNPDTACYDNYYPRGEVTLDQEWDTSSLHRNNMQFLGWSAERIEPIDTESAYASVIALEQYSIQARESNEVFAIWGVNPSVHYDVNTPAGAVAPNTPASHTVAFGSASNDTSGWVSHDTALISGFQFDGWSTHAQGGALFDFTTSLRQDVTLYARWSPVATTMPMTGGSGLNTSVVALMLCIIASVCVAIVVQCWRCSRLQACGNDDMG